MASQGNMVEAKVPDTGIDHTVGTGSHNGADDGSRQAIIPVMVFVYGKSSGDQKGAKKGCIDNDELPHCGMVVAEDLELCVEVVVAALMLAAISPIMAS
jgi:hypothetical protein